MNRIIEIFMQRDGLSKPDALYEYEELKSIIQDCLNNGEDYDEIEAILLWEYALEMDYLMDLI